MAGICALLPLPTHRRITRATLRDIPGHKFTPSPNGRPIVSAPNCAQSSMLRPMSASDRRARARAKRIHRRDQPKKTEHLPLSLKETDLKDPIKRAYVVPIEPRVLPDSSSARQLSEGSPLSAMKSGTWFGSTPYRCRTSSGPTCAISPAPWRVTLVTAPEARIRKMLTEARSSQCTGRGRRYSAFPRGLRRFGSRHGKWLSASLSSDSCGLRRGNRLHRRIGQGSRQS